MDEKPKRTIKKKFAIAEKMSKAKKAVVVCLGLAANVVIPVAVQEKRFKR